MEVKRCETYYGVLALLLWWELLLPVQSVTRLRRAVLDRHHGIIHRHRTITHQRRITTRRRSTIRLLNRLTRRRVIEGLRVTRRHPVDLEGRAVGAVRLVTPHLEGW